MTKIAILGANGRLGRVVAEAFLDAGYEVRAITRSGKLPAGRLEGATGVAADALNRDDLIRATQGVDIVFNGLNPPYTEWKDKCLPMARNVVAACRTTQALHLFPGNVYNFGTAMPTELREDTPFRPDTRKGAVRVEMEALFRREAEENGVQTAVLRAGDFFGGPGTGSWFDVVVTQKLPKGVFTAPGATDVVHEWAYLPDLARTFVALAERRDSLRPFETLHFPGHAVTALDMKTAVEKALGRSLSLGAAPWWLLKAGSPFLAMWREIVEMAYLQFQPHRLVSARLETLIGAVPHTRLDDAVAGALRELGLLKAAKIDMRAA